MAFADQIPTERIEWLWTGRIAFGCATLITGPSQVGKSTVLASIVAALTRGERLPGGPPLKPRRVLYLTLEDQPGKMTKPRLEAAGARLDSIGFVGYLKGGHFKERISFPSMTETMIDLMRQHKANVFVIDPIDSFIDAAMAEDNAFTARAISQALGNIARETNGSGLYVRHPRKGNGGCAMDQVRGSSEWTNCPRLILNVGAHPNKPGQLILSSTKHSLSKRPPSLECTIEEVGAYGLVKWHSESSLTADQVTGRQSDRAELRVLDFAKALIKDFVSGGQRKSAELLVALKAEGVSQGTINRARDELDLDAYSKQENGQTVWYCNKPKNGWPE